MMPVAGSVSCPNDHPADQLYYKRVGEVDTIICCHGCEKETSA